jgi:hypothetical protein
VAAGIGLPLRIWGPRGGTHPDLHVGGQFVQPPTMRGLGGWGVGGAGVGGVGGVGGGVGAGVPQEPFDGSLGLQLPPVQSHVPQQSLVAEQDCHDFLH